MSQCQSQCKCCDIKSDTVIDGTCDKCDPLYVNEIFRISKELNYDLNIIQMSAEQIISLAVSAVRAKILYTTE